MTGLAHERAEERSTAPLLGSKDADAAPLTSRRHAFLCTALYCTVMCINGGMIGAFGPSLECFQRSTGLGQGSLGTSVLQNRLAKLVGTVLWAWYATVIHSGKRIRLDAHVALAMNLVLTAMGCAVLGFTTSGFKLQVVMVLSGFAYGVTDSACAQLTLWVWEDDARWQRGCVALINACFTLGAFVTPMLVAFSLHYLNDTVWPAFHILSLCAIISVCAASRLASPRTHRKAKAKEVETDAVAFEADVGEIELATRPHGDLEKSTTPGTASKRKAAPAETEEYAGSGGQESCCERRGERSMGGESTTRVRLFFICISMIGFFANGCEHAVATWLSSYGVHESGLAEETMAIMTSNFWTAMSAGRLGWALCSSLVSSAFPVLLVNSLCCLSATLLFSQGSETFLLLGALGSGIGVSSSFPALVTLGPEARMEMTPRRMATLQLSASAGEMLCPFVLGVCFQFRLYHWFGPMNFVQQVVSFCALFVAWTITRVSASAPPS